jgi:hypothetical protein
MSALKSGDRKHGVKALLGKLHSRLFSRAAMDVGRLTSTTYCFVVVPSGAVTVMLMRVTVPGVRLTGLVVQSPPLVSSVGPAASALSSSYTTLLAPTPASFGCARRVIVETLVSDTEKA